MSEIYWITRLGVISTASNIIFGLSIAVLIVIILVYALHRFSEYYDEDELEEDNKCLYSIIKKVIPITIVSALIALFVPTKNELLVIYGIGGTIDYIQDNDKAKELPDKVINALDIYLDNINKKKED